MDIALLTHSINPRGGVVHVLELGQALHARGHDVTIVAPAAPGQAFFRDTPCRVELAPAPPAGASLAATVRARIDAMRTHLDALLRRRHFDALHAHDGIGANALADLDVPYLRTVHHVDRYGCDQVQDWETRSIRAAARVLCVSAEWCRRLSSSLGIEAYQVANGVDLARFSPSPQHTDDDVTRGLGVREGHGPVVLSVGGIEARKNSCRLLQAFIELRRRYPDAQLVIAGGASLLDHGAEVSSFHDLAARAGLAIGPGQPVVTTGALPDAALPPLYRRADVLAMPSLLEGFGLAALEALASGTPALVSHTEPFTEHFDDGDVEWADPLDVASIEVALRRAIVRGHHSEPPAVCRRFAWSTSAERHESLYRRTASA